MLPACLVCCSHKPAHKAEVQSSFSLCRFKTYSISLVPDGTRVFSVKPHLHPALLHTLFIIPLLNIFRISHCCTPGYTYGNLPFPFDSLGDVIVHSCDVSAVALTHPHDAASRAEQQKQGSEEIAPCCYHSSGRKQSGHAN